jgi:hypothetical protein
VDELGIWTFISFVAIEAGIPFGEMYVEIILYKENRELGVGE